MPFAGCGILCDFTERLGRKEEVERANRRRQEGQVLEEKERDLNLGFSGMSVPWDGVRKEGE